MFGLKKFLLGYWHRGYQQGKADGTLEERDRQYQERDKFRQIEMEQYLGKKVIAISNEWENPIVGVVVRLEPITRAMRPIPIIHDYITDTEVMCMAKMKLYTKQKLDAILSLDPYSVIALVYDCYDTDETFDKPKRGERSSSEQIIATLKANGFFDL